MSETVEEDLDALIDLSQELSGIDEAISRIKSQLGENEAKKKEYEKAVSSLEAGENLVKPLQLKFEPGKGQLSA